MSVTYGFYNAVLTDGVPDRHYDALDISRLFDGIISDGILPVGEKLLVSSAQGMNVNVGKGRAWFNHTWTYNDSLLTLPVEPAAQSVDRIDTVILEVNEETRTNDIRIEKGSTTPPILRNDSTVHQYALANINIPAGAKTVTVDNRRGDTSDPFSAPFVTPVYGGDSVTESFTVSDLIQTMTDDWNEYFESKQSDWDEQASDSVLAFKQKFIAEMNEWKASVEEALTPDDPQNYLNLLYMIESEVDNEAGLYANNWDAGGIYTIYSANVTANSNQEIMERFDPSESVSVISPRHSAWGAADIISFGQYDPVEGDTVHPGQGRFVIKALGVVPTIDIPITIIYRGVK